MGDTQGFYILPCLVAVRALVTMRTEPVLWSDELSFPPDSQKSHPGSVNKMTRLDGCLRSRDTRVCLSKMTQANIAIGLAALKWELAGELTSL